MRDPPKPQSKMLPCSSGANSINSVGRNAVVGGDDFSRLSVRDTLADFLDRGFINLREMVLRSPHGITNRSRPALKNPVPDVVGLASKEEMPRIDASRVVAAMKNAKGTRHPKGDLVRNPVREKGLVVVGNYAVAVAVARARPLPTIQFTAWFNPRPEVAGKRAKRLDMALLGEGRPAATASSFQSNFHDTDNSSLGHDQQVLEGQNVA